MHTIITGIIIAMFAYYKPITLKNLHYYYAVTLSQFTVVIIIFYIIYDFPMSPLIQFIVYIVAAYTFIYFVIKKFSDTSRELREMRQLNKIDFLTKLPNNRAIEEYLQNLFNKKVSFELLHVDIDSFKDFNTINMYHAGDEVLRQVANVLNEITSHKNAFVARIGGDEFCIILPNSSPAEAVNVAHEINNKVADNTFLFNEQQFSLTVSICACSYLQNGRSLEELYFSTINGLNAIITSEKNTVAHVNQLKQEGKLL